MDYGPFLTATIEVAPENIACKAIAIRLDEGSGGISKGRAFVVFDTDTLRYAAGWTGEGFIDWKNVAFDGSHTTHPSLVGQRVFSNPVGPGWANPHDGAWNDVRLRGTDGRCYGPLERNWAHWKGMYRNGHHVVLSYTVGTTSVLELPGLETADAEQYLTRTLQLGPRDRDLVLQVAADPARNVQLREWKDLQGTTHRLAMLASSAPAGDTLDANSRLGRRFDGHVHFIVSRSEDFDLTTHDYSVTARIRTTEGGTILSQAALSGPWVPNGKTLFIRGGKLCFDVGWVGVVESRDRIDDGQWHQVGLVFEAASGQVRLYVDGVLQTTAETPLRPSAVAAGQCLRIGYTAPNFPGPPHAFIGDMQYVRFYRRSLATTEMSAEEPRDSDPPYAQWVFAEMQSHEVRDTGEGQHTASRVEAQQRTAHDVAGVAVAYVSNAQVRWEMGPAGSLRLVIPRGAEPVRCKLLYAPLDQNLDTVSFVRHLIHVAPGEDLELLTRGAPTDRPQILPTTMTALGAPEGPFQAEVLTLPSDNPWRSWLRFSGFDFFADADRAAICSWQGDVWQVSGLRGPSGQLRWQRIASGLFQPLGLKIVADQIYVLGRDQITRLRDLNGDGATDFYENFNNDAQVTEHFHEFAMDLQTDRQGNFYYMKAARHALPSVVPQHGTLIRVTSDGQQSTILAGGFRAPDGLLVNDDGTFVSSDQEGHWTPMNRINWIRPGGFFGNMMAANPQGRAEDATNLPVCWIHREVDRSPTAQVWANDPAWGPLQGSLLSLSYGTGKTFRVLTQHVGEVIQGGIVQLPIAEFPTGIQRGRFHPDDGMLYVCGLFGWSSDKTLSGGFYRIRYTGQPLRIPEALAVYGEGVLLQFSVPVDRSLAGDRRNYSVSRWNYHRTENYGSDDYRVSDGKPGRDLVGVAGVSVSRDGRVLFLHIPDMRTCMQMRVRYQLRAEDGAPLVGAIDHTIHVLPDVDDSWRTRFADALAPPDVATEDAVVSARLNRGLALHFERKGSNAQETDARVARLVALRTTAGVPPSAYLSAGPFAATWTGFVNAELPEQIALSAEVLGEVTVTINGQEVLHTSTPQQELVTGAMVSLQSGPNPLQVRLHSLPDGQSHVRVFWTRTGKVSEPLAPSELWHDPLAEKDVETGMLLRTGRELVATHHCQRCHGLPAQLAHVEGLAELASDTPLLAGAGDRFRASWLQRWIGDPQSLRNHVTMPGVFAAPADSEAMDREIEDIVAYVVSLRGAGLQEPVAPRPESSEEDSAELAEAGMILYEDLGCIACHHFEAPDFPDPYERTSLKFAHAKYLPAALEAYLRAPHEDYAWRSMPDFQLTEEEAGRLAAYVRRRAAPLFPGESADAGDIERGRTAFENRGCLACHAVERNAAAPVPQRRPFVTFSSLATGCLAGDGVRRGNAPQFPFDEAQRIALVAFLQTDSTFVIHDAPAEAAQRAMARLRCTSCHRLDGESPTWPDVLAEEGEQGHPPESLPPLTWSGEKLHTRWLHEMLSGELPYRTRPWKKSRMAAFPVYAGILSEGLAAQHAMSSYPDAPPPANPAFAALGQKLTEKDQGFNCLQCHGLPGAPPEAPFESRGIDFQHVTTRVRSEFFRRWIGNPVQFDPSVPMPRFSADGRVTPVSTILDGDAPTQFDALWHYLRAVGR
ncbi:MAG: DUF6797 domain-containing protein [Pirellulaceae bacterium]